MKKIIAYVHTHWDREWYREFEEFRLRLVEVFDDVLNSLETGDLPCFYFDGQTAALEDYLQIRPEKIEEVKSFIKQKKLRIGPFYCSADSFLVSGESLYKNFEIGIKKSKEFGETDFIGYLSDTFGHSGCMPYILKALGIDKACLWRGVGNLPADLDWNGIKTTNLVQGYFQDFLSAQNLSIEEKAEYLKKYLDKISSKSGDCVLLPIGADHLAVSKNIQEQIRNLNRIYKDYKIQLATPFEYFTKISKRKNVSGEFLDNSCTFILPGVYSSRIYTKQANAKSQWLLTNIAEPLQALSYYYSGTKNKQSEIDYAYKTLIKNHAHDSIYGCNIDEVQRQVMQRFKDVDTISNGIIKRTLRDLSSKDGELSLINLSNREYTGTAEIITEKKLPKWMNAVKISSKKGFTDEKLYNINEIPVTEDITNINKYIIGVKHLKPFSITRLTKENILNDTSLIAKENSIENEFIKFEIKNNKILLTDKKKNVQYDDFIVISDRADIGDSYNFGALKGDSPLYAKLFSFKLKEKNIHTAKLGLKYEIKIPKSSNSKCRTKKTNRHIINIDAILYNGSEYIEFSADWENKSKNHILQIGFRLKEKITKTLNEDLYGTTERTFNPDFDIYEYIPAKRGIEIKPNTSPMQRFMNTQNVALITKGNCEYEVSKNVLKLTLLRAAGIISSPLNPCRGTPAGPPLDTPELQCIGKNKAEFALAFTNCEKDLYRLSDEFYRSVVPLFTNIEDKRFIVVDNQNIRITSISISEKGINLRLFNNSFEAQKANVKLLKKKNVKFLPREIKNIDFPLSSI